jgi:Cof subfamily protein (haloacid dehalogenase superfamily)
MIGLAVSDMDGTFLDGEGGFDRGLAREVLAEAHEAGIEFAACTGKQCERVEELFDGVWEDFWILGDSAARIKRAGEVRWEGALERGRALSILADLRAIDPDPTLIACAGDTAYVHSSTPEERRAVVRRSYRSVGTVEDYEQVPGEFVKLTAYDPGGRSTALKEALEPAHGEHAYIIDSERSWLDVTAPGIDKGKTLARLQERIGVGPERTLAFGDTLNDLALFERAEFSMCVSNGYQRVKDAAHFVIGSNEESAVLHTLRRFARAQAG